MSKSQYTDTYRKLLEVITHARKAKRLSQLEAAARLGRYRTYISKVEAGERRIDPVELAEICRLYRTDLVRVLRSAGLIR